MRTQQEIIDRIAMVEADGLDIFGAERGELIIALTYKNALPYLVEGTTAAEYKEIRCATDAAIRKAAIGYLDFAWGKADDERGLSANRSIDHYKGWLWLILSDADFERFVNTDPGWYGKGYLTVASELLGVPARVSS